MNKCKHNELLVKLKHVTKNNYLKMEENKSFVVIIPTSLRNFILDRFNKMNRVDIYHEFAGFLFGEVINEDITKYIIRSIDESYKNASFGQCMLGLPHVEEVKKRINAGLIGRWHTHYIPGFSVTDLKSVWNLELVAGKKDYRYFKLYGIATTKEDNEHFMIRPTIKIIREDSEEFQQYFSKGTYILEMNT